MTDLDNCDRVEAIRDLIQSKEALFKLYNEFYNRYSDCLKRCPEDGVVIEIGSGGGFLKEIVPDVVTTDIIPYKTVDIVMDASRLPLGDNSIRSIFMLNTLHHISNSSLFFNELVRCLKPGGRVLIIDQYCGWLSSLILKFVHHEPYDIRAKNWNFTTTGPLSGANGALCWIIFFRDRTLFEKLFPSLRIDKLTPNTPFRYWLAGGLKWWRILPGSLFDTATKLDDLLSEKFPQISSFVEVELVKTANESKIEPYIQNCET